jgi:hypothetical protein
MPSILQRTDPNPTSWTTDEHTWTFAPTVTPYAGAQGEWLDLWGTVLAVPRESGEPDGLYAPRILAEILRPTTTNVGLAQAIDEGLGIVGSQVVEAADVLVVYRFNSPGLRTNAATTTTTKRMNMAGPFGGTGLWCCFIVRLPTGAQQPYGQDTVQRIVDRRKASGTRLLGIYTAGGGAIITPDSALVGVSTNAYVVPIVGATYAWSIKNGVIESGQGTNSIQWHASAEGEADLTLVAKQAAGTTNYWKPVQVYSANPSAITTDLYQYAGTPGVVAAINTTGRGATIHWSATGLTIQGPSTLPVVAFDVGVANTLATLTVTIRNPDKSTATGTAAIKIVPYTSAATTATTLLPPNGTGYLEVDLGWAYDLVSVQSDRPSWVRIYNSDGARSADAGRPIDQDPADTLADLAWEGVFATGTLTIAAKPGVSGTNGDSPRSQTAYLAVTNLDTTTAVVNLIITRTEIRTSGNF